MRITVLYFGPVRELLGVSEETVDLGAPPESAPVPPGANAPPPGAAPTLASRVQELVRRHPALEPKLGFIRLARNEAMAEPADPLADGDVVALIPPVAGGAG